MAATASFPAMQPAADLTADVQRAERALAEDRFEAAADACHAVIRRARAAGDQPHLGWALMVLARAELRMRRLLPSFAAASEADALLQACGDAPRRLWAMNTSGAVLAQLGEATRALEMWRRCAAMAVGPEAIEVRFSVLINLCVLLANSGDHAERLLCLQEALAIARQVPALHPRVTETASRLAMAYLDFARALAEQGRPGDAKAQRIAAERTLQPLDLQRWRSFTYSERTALRAQIWALTRLGRDADARAAAAVALRGARGPHRTMLGYTYRGVANVHLEAGRVERALVYVQRAYGLARQIGDELEQTECRRDLVEIHARAGHWDRALEALRLARAGKVERLHHDNRLRFRLASLERQEERQRTQARQEQVHLRRLALIGRLIGQTHAALSSPITRVHALVQRAGAASPPAEQVRLLGEISAAVDRAAALVNQLKLFSYRSSPQLLALPLRGALLQAWEGLAPHLGGCAVVLDAGDESPVSVWADAQRLGILLKVLLIEFALHRGATSIRARITLPEPGRVALHLEAPGLAPWPGDADASLGLALCAEIAAEMGGALQAGGPCPTLTLRAATGSQPRDTNP